MSDGRDFTGVEAKDREAIRRALRQLVAGRIERRWEDWAKEHPHLAAVVDRVQLVESAVQRASEDPQFIEAIKAADVDEAHLTTALRLVELVEGWVRRLLPG